MTLRLSTGLAIASAERRVLVSLPAAPTGLCEIEVKPLRCQPDGSEDFGGEVKVRVRHDLDDAFANHSEPQHRGV